MSLMSSEKPKPRWPMWLGLPLLTLTPVVVEADEVVVLLHGLARTDRSMAKLGRALSKEGYPVVNLHYPSRSHDIPSLAEMVGKQIATQTADAAKVHFVTHSMGGIVLRQFLAARDFPRLGRVVMLSPPNQGSEVVDALGDTKVFHWINGPGGQQLGTAEDGFLKSLPAADFELGIITGDRSINWINSLIIPGSDDGKVSLENAKVDGMTDYRAIHATHPFIMRNSRAIALTKRFLKHGGFAHEHGGRRAPRGD